MAHVCAVLCAASRECVAESPRPASSVCPGGRKAKRSSPRNGLRWCGKDPLPSGQLYDDGKAGAGSWRRRRHLGAIDRAIEGIAFDGYAACVANQAFELGSRRELVGGGSGIVINPFFDNSAVK